MKEIILLKYGEIVLKGLNRSYFNSVLEVSCNIVVVNYETVNGLSVELGIFIEDVGTFEDDVLSELNGSCKVFVFCPFHCGI